MKKMAHISEEVLNKKMTILVSSLLITKLL